MLPITKEKLLSGDTIQLLFNLIIVSLSFFSIVLGIDTVVFISFDRVFILLLIAYFFYFHFTNKSKIALPKDGFDKTFLLFIVYVSVVTVLMFFVYQYNYSTSVKKIFTLVIEYYLFYMAAKSLLQKVNLNSLIKTMKVVVIITSVYGILEFIIRKNLFFQMVLYLKLPFNQNYRTELLWGQIRGGLLRAESTFSHPLEFGAFLSLFVPFLLYIAFNIKQTKKERIRIAYLLGLILLAIVGSISRTILLIVFGIGLLYFFMTKRVKKELKKKIAIYSSIGLVLVSFLLFKFLFPEGLFKDTSILIRFNDYFMGLKEFMESPIFGKGYGTNLELIHFKIDNFYLSLLMETGLIGTLLFLLAFGTLLVGFFRKYRSEQDLNKSDYYLSLYLFVLSFLLLNLSFDAMGFVTLGKFFFLLLAMALSYEKFIPSQLTRSPYESIYHHPNLKRRNKHKKRHKKNKRS